jgi:hypothetical protein
MEKTLSYTPAQPLQAPISAAPMPMPEAHPYHIHLQIIHYHQQMLMAHLHHCYQVYRCCPVCGHRPVY